MSDIARISAGYSHAKLARSQLEAMEELLRELPPEPSEKDDWLEWLHDNDGLLRQISYSAAITIVFAAITAEAYIYDFAARKLGDGFTTKYLDRLELKAKWIVIPRLATGHEFSSDSQAFEALRELVRSRNRIVHSKSKNWLSKPPEEWEEESEGDTLEEGARKALSALDLLGEEAKSFDSLPVEGWFNP